MDNELDAAANRIEQAIVREATTVGPHELGEDGEPDPGKPLEYAQLREWVLVMSWTDSEGDPANITRITSKGLVPHHEVGLLHSALDFL